MLHKLPYEIYMIVFEYLQDTKDVINLDIINKTINKYQYQIKDKIYTKNLDQKNRIKYAKLQLFQWKHILQPYIMLTCNEAVYLFDIYNESFTEISCMLENRFTRYYYNIIVRNQREVVTFSAQYSNFSSAIEKWDIFNQKWSKKDSILPNIVGMSICVDIEGNCYISGGYNKDEAMQSNQIFYYNIQLHTISTCNPMSIPRDGHSSIIFQNKLYIAGGFANGTNTNIVECYNVTTNEWELPSFMLKSRYSFSLLVILNELYAVGGDDAETIEKFDIINNIWFQFTAIKNKRAHAAICSYQQYIYFFGGSSAYFLFDSSWDAFNVLTGTWLSSNLLKSERCLPMTNYSNGYAVVLDSYKLHYLLASPSNSSTVMPTTFLENTPNTSIVVSSEQYIF